MKAIIFDTETTGLTLPSVAPIEKQPRIIELGVLLVDNNGILDEYGQLIYPGCAITEEITKITKITNEDLRDKPLFSSCIGSLTAMFGQAQMLIGHNLGFDMDMLSNELRMAGVKNFPWPGIRFCTAQEFAPIIGHRPHQTTLYERILGKPLEQTHRALDDVKALWEVIQHENILSLME